MNRTIVASECGHFYATIWIDFMSFKAVRLGGKRLQRCPVCRKRAWVSPADTSRLTAEELRQAQQTLDSPIP